MTKKKAPGGDQPPEVKGGVVNKPQRNEASRPNKSSSSVRKYDSFERFELDLRGGFKYQDLETIRANQHLLTTRQQRRTIIDNLKEYCMKDPNENRYTKDDCKALIEELEQPEGSIRIGSYKLLFTDPVKINPALDILPDRTLILGLQFAADREIADRNGNSYTRRELANFILTSWKEIFPCVEREFAKRDLFATIPETNFGSRWSKRSIKEFLSGDCHRDPFQVYELIKGQFEKYIDFGENGGAAAFCSLYAILTYFFVLFDRIPYLKFEGIRGSGKSKAGTGLPARRLQCTDVCRHVPAQRLQDRSGREVHADHGRSRGDEER